MTRKYFFKKAATFLKITFFQYFVLITYSTLFLIPIFVINWQANEINIYFILFMVIFPMIQSMFHMYYVQTGSLYSRFEVWMGMIIYFFIIPIVVAFL